MPQTFIDRFDSEALKDEAYEMVSKQVKRDLIKAGYKYQMSLYGIITHSPTGLSNYRRFEVFSDVPYTEYIVRMVYYQISDLKPPDAYSIWVYSGKRDAIKEVARYGPKRENRI